MTSLRESPIRKQRPPRPSWLLPLLVVVGIAVVAGIGYGVVSLVRGSSGSAEAESASASAQACATELVPVSGLLPKPAKVTVNVYNATTVAGLASKTAVDLEKRGFKVGKVANDPAGRKITGVGQIRFGPKGADQAQLVLVYVPGAELVELDRKGRKVDLAMGDAFTALAPEPEVTAALASTTPVVSGPGCSAAPATTSSPG